MRKIYNPQIQISAESETKRSIFREKDKTKRSKKESAQHSKSRNKSFVMKDTIVITCAQSVLKACQKKRWAGGAVAWV